MASVVEYDDAAVLVEVAVEDDGAEAEHSEFDVVAIEVDEDERDVVLVFKIVDLHVFLDVTVLVAECGE